MPRSSRLTGLVEDSEQNVDFEGGSLGTRGGGGGDLVELGLATVVDGASVKELRECET